MTAFPHENEKGLTASGCEQCGRAFGDEMLTCSDRPRGACPFTREKRPSFQARLFLAVISLLPLSFLVLLILQDGPLLGILIATIVASIFLFSAFSTHIELVDAQRGVQWKRDSIIGVELGQSLLVRAVDNGPPPPAPVSLSNAGSHTAYFSLCDRRRDKRVAAYLFHAALADLLGRELLLIRTYIQYRRRADAWARKKMIYLLAPGPRLEAGQAHAISGKLERRITEEIRAWDSAEGRDGVPVYELVRAVYGSDKSAPVKWLFALVEADLVASGFAHKAGLFRRMTLTPEAAETIGRGINKLDALKQWMRAELGISETDLLGEIERGIGSRQDSGDNWWA